MMDIGTFLQQFDFMGHSFLGREEINKYKEFTRSDHSIIDLHKQILKTAN